MAAAALSASSSRVVAPIVTEMTLHCSDGIKLAAQLWKKASDTTEIKDEGATSSDNKRRILCLHGWMDNANSFHHLAPAIVQHFPAHETELVALDFPGHGLSSHKSIDGPPALLSEAAFYVNEALTQLKWNHESTPFVLIGHSMGAAVSTLYAAAFPEFVKSLVLLEGGGPLARNAREIANHVRQHVHRRQIGIQSPKQPRIYPSLDVAVETRRQSAKNFPGNQWLSQVAARAMVERGTRPVQGDSGGVQFRHDPRLQWPSLQYFTLEQTEALYQGIQCPTALLVADDGWPFDADKMQRTLDLLKPVVHSSLPGSHHFHADPESADRVSTEVIRFLEDC